METPLAHNHGLLSFAAFFFTALLFAGFLFAPMIQAQQQPTLNLMPMPESIQFGSGSLAVGADFSVALTGYTEARLTRAVERFEQQLTRQTGIPIFLKTADGSKAILVIHTDHASKPVQELGEDESYMLEITASGAKLTAPTPLGIMHGLQTLLQLTEASSSGFAVPVVTIQDKPRFPWRGLMIDSARHFIPFDVIKRNLDGMEAVKMNVFHWHLSENQGFRIESKKFPKLHELGSDDLYYTQDEVHDLIAYARDRGIRVVPEFDMPGHSTAWFVGHPELASGPGPYQIERRWGVFDPAMDPTNEKTYKFLDQLVEEMTKLFPDQYFHIGGDEVNGKQWDANPQIQAFMKAHGFKNNDALQVYFSQRIQKIVNKHGKSVIGWDEILVPGVPKDIVIQSWRGQASLAQAAKQELRGILSSGYYLDLGWPASRHYLVDPTGDAAASLSPEEKQRILGGESCMWTEHVTAETVDSRIWPRNAVIAERLWSPEGMRDVPSMYARMEVISQRLEWLGLTHKTYYRSMLQRIAGNATPDEFAALRVLADTVEPMKDYTRGKYLTAELTSATPLNRLVDAVEPESDTSRHFAELTDRYIASSCRDSQIAEQLRWQLTLWQQNDARLHADTSSSFLLRELVGTSKGLSVVGATGLFALDSLAKGGHLSDADKKQKLAELQSAEDQSEHAQLILAAIPAVQKLLEAAATGNCSGVNP